MTTTSEENREKKHDEIVDALQSLLEKNYDAEKGFKNAIDNTKHHSLKTYLKEQAVKRNRFATEIDFEIRALNAKPKESGSASASIHRAWMDLKSAIAGNDDEAILEECIRGEKASVEEYEEVIEKHTLPTKIEQVITKQLGDIKQTLTKIKSLEDLAD
ncbi:MAG: PA2169 family four-helix-bundle protein [Leeuwenhoekiella sp.]